MRSKQTTLLRSSIFVLLLLLCLPFTLLAEEGLLLHYTFDAGAGIDIIDAAGNENNALMYNMGDTCWVEGKSGMALKYNGEDQYVNSTDPFIEPLGLDFTVSLWFKAAPDQNSRIFSLNSGIERLINIRCNENVVGIDDKGGVGNESTLYGDITVTDGEWHHFAMTRTETVVTLYLDGEWLLDTPVVELMTMDHVTIGARSNADGTVTKNFSGQIDEFKIYIRAMSDAELYALATGTAVKEDQPQHLIQSCQLYQNYPNPFNPSTRIKYALSKPGHVTLKIFDVRGKEVASLVDDYQTSGIHKVTWQASGLASGIYFYQLKADEFNQTRKLLIQK